MGSLGLTLKNYGSVASWDVKGLIMIAIYGVIAAACVTINHVFELDKNTIKFIERDNESFTVIVVDLSNRVRAEMCLYLSVTKPFSTVRRSQFSTFCSFKE